MTTLNFNDVTIDTQVKILSDLFVSACSEVNYIKRYFEITDREKESVKIEFFNLLNIRNTRLTSDIIKQAENEFPESQMISLLRQYGYYRISKETLIAKATETLNKYQGKKVTVVKFSDFGFPIVWNTLLHSVDNKPYAQYNESLQIIHKPKRKRTYLRHTILPKESIVVFEGWHDIDMEKLTYNTVSENSNMTVKQSKYTSFDNDYLTDIITYIGK